MVDLNYLSIAEAHRLLKNQKVSVVELVGYYLQKIHNLDPKIRATLTVIDKEALEKAKLIDRKIKAGEKFTKLSGIPYTAKDMFLTRGIRTTAASKILDNYIPPYSATVIEKLERAGAILLAKVNQDEFGHGGSTENSAYHVTHNPWDLDRVSGGSSGGSAAAVAADFGIFSLGTDTGGSIRQPAAFCGVTGLKPTYGLVSRYGVVAMASSLDVIGPIARSAEDAAIVLKTIAGVDPMDSTTISSDLKTKTLDLKSLRIGVIEIANGFDFISDLEVMRLSIENIKFDRLLAQEALAAYYVLTPSEISSNLERYDGIKFGSRVDNPESLLETYTKTRADFFGKEVKRRIIIGTYALSSGYYDAYYKKAMQVRTLICQNLNQLFDKYDFIISPTTLSSAFKFGEKSDPVEMYKADVLTVIANLAGIPAISIPAGLDSNGMPIGMQIMAPQKQESKLLSFAQQFQKVTDYHLQVVGVMK